MLDICCAVTFPLIAMEYALLFVVSIAIIEVLGVGSGVGVGVAAGVGAGVGVGVAVGLLLKLAVIVPGPLIVAVVELDCGEAIVMDPVVVHEIKA
jgi:hypothetical protein